MRKPVLLIFVNAMILIVIFALLTQSLVVMQRLAIAQNISGKVEVQRGGRGSFRAMATGDAIKTGDIVRAAGDGNAEFKWLDGTRWKILPGTQLTVKKATFNVVKRAEQSQLQLDSGKVFIRIMKELAPASRFEVETPTAVAAVRGTIFSVEVKNGETQIAVFKGSVKVSRASGETMMLASGQSARAGAAKIQTEQDAKAVAAFRQQSSIVAPELNVEVESQESGQILVKGETEAGDDVTINGEKVRVLGNGVFRKSLDVPTTCKFVVSSTDRHGATTTVTKTVPNSAQPCTAAP